ncbi:hypothetical protein D3C71_2226820 [compost metagenome]
MSQGIIEISYRDDSGLQWYGFTAEALRVPRTVPLLVMEVGYGPGHFQDSK